MPKKLVVLLDGTNNQFGDNNTNIVRLLSVLHQNEEQVVFYSAGVGTFGLNDVVFQWQQLLPRILGLAFGWGVRQTLESAYRFLMDNYEPGDEVYVFGFSRGAYTARSLCAMLKGVGLLQRHMPNQFKYAYELMKQVKRSAERDDKRGFAALARFRSLYSRTCRVRFLGVFDTVKSVGWVYSPFSFLYTASNDAVRTVRHAVSLDERRCFFRQNLWNGGEGQDCEEMWFAGVHSDVGGGYPEAQSGLAKVALKWMCEAAAKEGLGFHEAKYEQIVLGNGAGLAKPDPLAEQHESLRGWWWLAELLPRRYQDPQQAYRTRIEFPLVQWSECGRYRRVAGPIQLHPSALERVQGNVGYVIPSVTPG